RDGTPSTPHLPRSGPPAPLHPFPTRRSSDLLDQAVTSVSESLFGCAGQRCLAGSVVVTPGKAYAPVRDRLVEAAKNLRLGYGLRSEEHTSELHSRFDLVCRLLLVKKNQVNST